MKNYTPEDFPCLIEVGFEKNLIQDQLDSVAVGVLEQAADISMQQTYFENLKSFVRDKEYIDDQYFALTLFFWEIDFFAMEASRFKQFMYKIKEDLGEDYFSVLNDDFYENGSNNIFALYFVSYNEDKWNKEIERLMQSYKEYHS